MIEQGRRVVAFGDSDVDALMLQGAEKAVVVVNHRRNNDLLPHLRTHPGLSQISNCQTYHRASHVSNTHLRTRYWIEGKHAVDPLHRPARGSAPGYSIEADWISPPVQLARSHVDLGRLLGLRAG